MSKENKSDKNTNNEENVGVEATSGSTPASVYTPPTELLENDATVASAGENVTAPVTKIGNRRLGTGVIIGISAAAVALIAGVFGGGIAVGATAANHGPSGDRPQMESAEGPMQGGAMEHGEKQGGAMEHGEKQGGKMQGGKMQGGPGSDLDGHRGEDMPRGHDADHDDMMPRSTDSSTGSSSTPAPTN